MLSQSQRFGLAGELWLFEQFRLNGYDVTMPSYFCQPGADMLLDGFLPVHVLTASMKPRKISSVYSGFRYQFNLVRIFSKNPTGSAIVALLAFGRSGFVPFFVPLDDLRDRCLTISITSDPSDFTGWLARYRNSWPLVRSQVGMAMAEHRLTLPLFV